MEEVIGKIQWMGEKPVEYPEKSGKFNLGIKVRDAFYNLYATPEKLEKIAKTLKKGFEVKLTVTANKIEELEVLNDKIEEKIENKKASGNWADDMTNFEDLLKNAHEKFKDKISITTEMLQVDFEKKTAVFKACVIIDFIDSANPELCRKFEAHGDAQGIGSDMIKPHFMRMAETRAIARALRWATNNAAVSEEETDVKTEEKK